MSVSGSLSAEMQSLRTQLPSFLLSEADRASGLMRDQVRDRTPIGRIVNPQTGLDLGPSGKLRRSIRPLPVMRIGADRWLTGAYSRVSYASFVEDGTRAHVIDGNQNLRFWSQGQLFYRKQVKHPGAPGQHMFLRGALAAEVLWQGGADTRLQNFLVRVA